MPLSISRVTLAGWFPLLGLDPHDQPDVRQAKGTGDHRGGAAEAGVVRAAEPVSTRSKDSRRTRREGAAGGHGVAAQKSRIGEVDRAAAPTARALCSRP